ncbi:hypothetical protein Goari_024986, partial [Gossypium aridum]|nr:hypothetical protein [Gossypium aridum]
MIFNERVLIPFAAEAIACLQAIQAGLEMGLRRIVIEGDALSVIRQSSNRVAHKLVRGAVESLRNTNLGHRLSRKAMLALEEDARSLAVSKGDERTDGHGG